MTKEQLESLMAICLQLSQGMDDEFRDYLDVYIARKVQEMRAVSAAQEEWVGEYG